MTKLSERAMLVSLHIGAYTGMMLDREVTEEVSNNYKADLKEAGRYNKRLIASKFLHDVTSAHNHARKVHRLLTLPWEDDGTRILTTVGFLPYQQKMREAHHKVDAAVKTFIDGLPDYINEASVRLGSMFNKEDYPDADTLRDKFSFDVEIKSLPEAGDFRAQLSDEATKAIVKDIEKRCNQRLENALNDVFTRVVDVVKRMVERLRAYQPAQDGKRASGIIRDSIIYDIHELAEMLPNLNITGDPRITKLKDQLMAELVDPASPEILRVDTKARQAAINNAEKILKRVEGYLK